MCGRVWGGCAWLGCVGPVEKGRRRVPPSICSLLLTTPRAGPAQPPWPPASTAACTPRSAQWGQAPTRPAAPSPPSAPASGERGRVASGAPSSRPGCRCGAAQSLAGSCRALLPCSPAGHNQGTQRNFACNGTWRADACRVGGERQHAFEGASRSVGGTLAPSSGTRRNMVRRWMPPLPCAAPTRQLQV